MFIYSRFCLLILFSYIISYFILFFIMFRVVSVLSTSRTTNNTYVVGVKNDFFIRIVMCSRRTLTP